MLIGGSLDIFFTYKDKLKSISDSQQQQSSSTASNIAFFIGGVQMDLILAAQYEYDDSESGIAAREVAYLSLIKRVPYITRLQYWGSDNQETLMMSQFGREAFSSTSPLPAEKVAIAAKVRGTFNGPVYLDENSIPHITMGIALPGDGKGVLTAEVSLRPMQVIISRLSLGSLGWVYVVDSDGFVVSHPLQRYISQRTNASHLAQVENSIRAGSDRSGRVSEATVSVEKSLDGQTVFATSAPIESWGLYVLAEHPRSEALFSLQGPIIRSALLSAGGLVLAVLTSLILARKMVSPILKLRDAAERVGSGSTEEVDLKTGDELESLGRAFNRLSAQIRESHATLEKRVEERTKELARTNANLESEIVHLETAEEEAKVMNQRLAEANLNLERRVAERTSDLRDSNERLIEAQDQLVRKEKLAAIGQLSAGVAHDIRNSLGAIKNAIYYLNRKLLDSDSANKNPRIPEFLKIIDDEVELSNKIISDLLDFARISTTTLLPANIGTMVHDCLGSLKAREGIYVLENNPEELLQVHADVQQLQRVFLNLLINAQDAMPDGGVITVSTTKTNGFAEIAISDNGEGINPENIAKIFDPLFTTKSKGTRLGLAVCQQIVSKHGGVIEVESLPGNGATFKVKLPLSVSENLAQEVLNATA